MKTKSLRGQIALEFLILVVFMVAFVVIMFYFAHLTAVDAISVQKVQSAADSLAKTADEAYTLGPGSKLYAEIELPPGIKGTIATGKEIGYKLQTSSGLNSIWKVTKAEIVASLPTKEGRHRIAITMQTNGRVRAGDGIAFPGGTESISLPPGGSDSMDISITNLTDDTLTGLNYSLSGDFADYATVDSGPYELAPGEEGTVTLDVSVPGGEPPGKKGGTLSAGSDQGLRAEQDVSLQVESSGQPSIVVKTYCDAAYTQECNTFQRGQTVYYRVEVFDEFGNPADVTDMADIVIDGGGTPRSQQQNLETQGGVYQGAFPIPMATQTGTWSIEKTATVNGQPAGGSTVFNVVS